MRLTEEIDAIEQRMVEHDQPTWGELGVIGCWASLLALMLIGGAWFCAAVMP